MPSTIPFEVLRNEPYRRWYRFGLSSPTILYRRFRNKHRPVFETKMAWQRVRRGHSDDQLWNLSHSTARLLVAGVAKLREWNHGHPSEITNEEWVEILTKIEAGFQAFLDSDGWFYDSPDLRVTYDEGMALFAEWFGALWD